MITRDEIKALYRERYTKSRLPLERHRDRRDGELTRLQDRLYACELEIEVLDEMIAERSGI